jgi:hypothetical protein
VRIISGATVWRGNSPVLASWHPFNISPKECVFDPRGAELRVENALPLTTLDQFQDPVVVWLIFRRHIA